jgi:hypothetical protein
MVTFLLVLIGFETAAICICVAAARPTTRARGAEDHRGHTA